MTTHAASGAAGQRERHKGDMLSRRASAPVASASGSSGPSGQALHATCGRALTLPLPPPQASCRPCSPGATPRAAAASAALAAAQQYQGSVQRSQGKGAAQTEPKLKGDDGQVQEQRPENQDKDDDHEQPVAQQLPVQEKKRTFKLKANHRRQSSISSPLTSTPFTLPSRLSLPAAPKTLSLPFPTCSSQSAPCTPASTPKTASPETLARSISVSLPRRPPTASTPPRIARARSTQSAYRGPRRSPLRQTFSAGSEPSDPIETPTAMPSAVHGRSLSGSELASPRFPPLAAPAPAPSNAMGSPLVSSSSTQSVFGEASGSSSDNNTLRPILRHQKSAVRISSPLRQQVGYEEEPKTPIARRGPTPLVDSPGLPVADTDECELLAPPDVSDDDSTTRSLRGRAGTRVAWAQTIHNPPLSRSPLNARDCEEVRQPLASHERNLSGGERRSMFDRRQTMMNAPAAGKSMRRQPSINSVPGNRPLSAPAPGLWADVAVTPAPTSTPSLRSSIFSSSGSTTSGGRTRESVHEVHPSTALPGVCAVEFADKRAPTFSRSGLRRAGVVMPVSARPASVAVAEQHSALRSAGPPRPESKLLERSESKSSFSSMSSMIARKLSKRSRSVPLLSKLTEGKHSQSPARGSTMPNPTWPTAPPGATPAPMTNMKSMGARPPPPSASQAQSLPPGAIPVQATMRPGFSGPPGAPVGPPVSYTPVYVLPGGAGFAIPQGAPIPPGFVSATPPNGVQPRSSPGMQPVGYGPGPGYQHTRSSSLGHQSLGVVYSNPITQPILSPPGTPRRAHPSSPQRATRQALRHYRSNPGMRPVPLEPLPELVVPHPSSPSPPLEEFQEFEYQPPQRHFVPVGGYEGGGLIPSPEQLSPIDPPSPTPSPFQLGRSHVAELTDLVKREQDFDLAVPCATGLQPPPIEAPRLANLDFGASAAALLAEFTLPDLPTPTDSVETYPEPPPTPKALESPHNPPSGSSASSTISSSSVASRPSLACFGWSPPPAHRSPTRQGRSASACSTEVLAAPSAQKLSYSAPPTPLLSSSPLFAPQPRVESAHVSPRTSPEKEGPNMREETDMSALDTDNESVSSWERPTHRDQRSGSSKGTMAAVSGERPSTLVASNLSALLERQQSAIAPPPRGQSLMASSLGATSSRSGPAFTVTTATPVSASPGHNMRSPSTMSLESDTSVHSTTSSQRSISSLTSASSAASVDMPDPIAEDDGDDACTAAAAVVKLCAPSTIESEGATAIAVVPVRDGGDTDSNAIIKRGTVTRVKSAVAMRMRVSSSP